MDAQHLLLNHLLRRAGFGATPAELEHYVQLGYAATVEQLLNYDQIPDSYPDFQPTPDAKGRVPLEPLQEWWATRMLTTSRPLQEKMVLFWHGHFATANYKVDNAVWMYNQNQLFRQNALVPFGKLLSAVSKDPAMMKWLDLEADRKGSPNENYAREVMELFTLGIGNYSEQDVKEGARALTGWTYTKDSTVGKFAGARFDDGPKTFLGQTGNFGLEDVVNILAGSPATAKFLAAKLARYFISDTPDPGTIDAIAGSYAASGGDMRQVLRTVFNSNAFKDPANFWNKVKSPAEYVLTNLRLLGVSAADRTAMGAMRDMGQELFNPPNVAGWAGGRAWVNTDTVFSRLNFFNRVAAERSTDQALHIDPGALLNGAADAPGFFLNLLTDGFVSDANRTALQTYFTAGSQNADAKLRGLVHLVLSTPTAQMN